MADRGHMTLERHRSTLIPDVQYSLDGTLFVTDTGGTFPLRGKGPKRGDIRDAEYQDVEQAQSFRSFDPRREEKKRRFKQRSPSREIVVNGTGTSTVSTNNTSSLGRRLRRSKRRQSGKESRFPEKGFTFKENGYGSMSGSQTRSRLRSGPPRMTPEFADTIRRKKAEKEAARSANIGNISKNGTNSLKRTKRSSKGEDDFFDFNRKDSQRSQKSQRSSYLEKDRYHKIHDEKLPYIVFIIAGVLLLLVGVTRIIVSYWHEYYSALWTGLLALTLGIIGAKHKGLYLAKAISGGYIFMAFLTGFAALISSGLVLRVFIPIIMLIADSQEATTIIRQVRFTNMDKTLSTVDMSVSAMTWVSVGLDISTIIFLFVSYFAMTAAMIGLSNHWDACYDTTEDCDHRGNPRLFNPIEQVGLGVATGFIGLVYVSAEAGFSNVSHDHYYSPTWAAGMVIVSGVISFCFGKRPDQLAMGTFACFVEILAFLTCGAATVLTTLGMVDDVSLYQSLPDTDKGSTKFRELLAMILIAGVLDFTLTINVIFIVGTVFRQFRQICCRNCCQRKPDPYGSMERGPSRFNSLERHKYKM